MKLIKSITIFLASVIIFNIISILAFPIQVVRKSFKNNDNLYKYFINLAIGEDQRAGSYIYATEDFTVSSMCYYYGVLKNNRFARYFMYFVDFFARILAEQKEHCKQSYYKELKEFENRAKRGK